MVRCADMVLFTNVHSSKLSRGERTASIQSNGSFNSSITVTFCIKPLSFSFYFETVKGKRLVEVIVTLSEIA